MKTEEVWVDIKDFEGMYQISNLGRVKSLARTRKGPRNTIQQLKEKILTPVHLKKDNQYVVQLRKDGISKGFLINRLVASAFLPNPNPEIFDVVGHKDGNKANSALTNLYWTSFAQVNLDNKQASKLDKKDVLKIRKMYFEERKDTTSIGKKFNVTNVTVRNIIANITFSDVPHNYMDHIKEIGKGERSHKRKLSNEQVQQLRDEYAKGGITQRQLAKKYGIHQANVWAIISRRVWKHL